VNLYVPVRRPHRHHRALAITYTPSRPLAASAPALSWDQIVGAVRGGLLLLLLLCWMGGAYGGIVYWSLQGSLLGVLASAVVPGLAATFTWWAFAALEKPVRR